MCYTIDMSTDGIDNILAELKREISDFNSELKSSAQENDSSQKPQLKKTVSTIAQLYGDPLGIDEDSSDGPKVTQKTVKTSLAPNIAVKSSLLEPQIETQKVKPAEKKPVSSLLANLSAQTDQEELPTITDEPVLTVEQPSEPDEEPLIVIEEPAPATVRSLPVVVEPDEEDAEKENAQELDLPEDSEVLNEPEEPQSKEQDQDSLEALDVPEDSTEPEVLEPSQVEDKIEPEETNISSADEVSDAKDYSDVEDDIFKADKEDDIKVVEKPTSKSSKVSLIVAITLLMLVILALVVFRFVVNGENITQISTPITDTPVNKPQSKSVSTPIKNDAYKVDVNRALPLYTTDGSGFVIYLTQTSQIHNVVVKTNYSGEPGGTAELRSTLPNTPKTGEVLATSPLQATMTFELSKPTDASTLVIWISEIPPNAEASKIDSLISIE
ncbi:hypothetical protein FACS1894125_1000 [Actinomycetota bacterium]|nr:hypothetical protein FACS1894125_1000 [Actinomycetota bacterium]